MKEGQSSHVGTAAPSDAAELHRYWLSIFEQLDEDRDGKIPFRDLEAVLNVSAVAQFIPDAAREELLEIASWSQDESLSSEDFLIIVLSRQPETVTEKRVHKCFRMASNLYVNKRQRSRIIRIAMTDYPAFAVPVAFVLTILIVEVAVFAYFPVWCRDRKKEPYMQDCLTASWFAYGRFRMRESWRFFSYSLLHVHGHSFAINILLQVFVCLPLGLVHSAWKIPVVHIVGTCFAAVGASVFDSVPLIGAASGTYAVLWSHFGDVLVNFREFDYALFRLIAVMVFTASDVALSMSSGLGWVNHVAGTYVGLTVGRDTLLNRKMRRSQKVGTLSSMFLMFVLFAYCVMFRMK